MVFELWDYSAKLKTQSMDHFGTNKYKAEKIVNESVSLSLVFKIQIFLLSFSPVVCL